MLSPGAEAIVVTAMTEIGTGIVVITAVMIAMIGLINAESPPQVALMLRAGAGLDLCRPYPGIKN
jgi:hypothetical protein